MAPGTNKGGRPTKRSPKNEDAIIVALSKGYTRKAAAAFGGVTYSTLRDWELRFPEFAEALEKAEGIAQNDLIDTIVRASKVGSIVTRPDGSTIEYPGAWQAAAWVLERRWSQEYGRRERLDVTFDPKTLAEKVATEYGLDPSEVLAEAERHLSLRR